MDSNCIKCIGEDLTGKNWMSYCKPSELKSAKKMLETINLKKIPTIHTNSILHPTKGYCKHRFINSPTLDENGNVIEIRALGVALPL